MKEREREADIYLFSRLFVGEGNDTIENGKAGRDHSENANLLFAKIII